jgi:hypothetical protein
VTTNAVSGGVATFTTSLLTASEGHQITVTYTGDNNYTNNASSPTVSQEVDQAALTVTANDDEKTYDGNAYSGGNGVYYAGFVNEQTNTVLGGTLSYGGSAQGAVNANTYAITPQGLTSVNYHITFDNGTLRVDQATPILSFTVAPFKYGQVLTNAAAISGTAANPISSINVAGAYAFTYPNTVVTVTGPQSVTFTPNDTLDYVLVTNVATVTVGDPAIITQPTNYTVVLGGNASFRVVASGTGPLYYQWQQNNVLLPGQTASTLVLNTVADSAAGSYSVTVSNVNGTITSSQVMLTIKHPPVFLTQPTSLTVNQGNSASFSVTLSGASPFSYQWSHNSQTITAWLPVAGDAGNYSVEVTNSDGVAYSSNAVLTVIIPPAITGQPTGITNNAGTTATFSVTNTGSAAAYYWYKNATNLLSDDGVKVVGSATATLIISNILGADTATYDVVISNAAATVTSTYASLLVIDPIITNEPVSLTNNATTSATFTVGAYGTALQYQWQKNGAVIPGATSASYTIASVADGNVASYSVIVSNSFGCVTSAPAAMLTVIDPPTINTQPQSQTVNQGAGATFTVGYGGTSPAFQWYTNGLILAGATSASLNLSGVTPANSVYYTVVLTNAAGSITSAPAFLTVIVPPAITGGPSSLTNNAGTTASFSVTNTGSASVYRWYFNATNLLTDGGYVTGSATATLTISNVLGANSGTYSVLVSNAASAQLSPAATLVVIDPVISSEPAGVTNFDGTTVSFTVGTVGTTPMSYQWYQDGYVLDGSTNSTLTLDDIADNDVGEYSVVITNIYGCVTSTPAALVTVLPLIVTEPADVSINQGQTANFSVSVNGETPFTYQWRLNGTNILNATNNILSLANVQAAQAGNYDVVVHNPIGIEYSDLATLTVTVAPSITTAPQSLAVFAGQPASFTVAYTGSTASIQWYTNGVAVGGATSATLAFAQVTAANAASYTVTLINNAGNVTSTPAATLTVYGAPVITQQPTNLVAVAGQASPAVLNVTATGMSAAYQWYFKNAAVPTATSHVLSLSALTTNNSGSYFVTITNPAGAVTSSVVTLAVYATTAPHMALTHAGGAFTVNATGVPGYTYEVDASTNLTSWLPLTTNTSPVSFIDTNAGGFDHRFYRSIYLPAQAPQ